MRFRGDTSDLNGRVISYLYKGDYKMIDSLFKIGFLQPDDTFDTTGRGTRGNPEDLSPLLIHLARYPCPNYKELIDTLLANGISIDDGDYVTPLETAIIYENYPTAAYLMYNGGTYNIAEIDTYNLKVNKDLLNEVKKEFDLLVSGVSQDEWRGIPIYGK